MTMTTAVPDATTTVLPDGTVHIEITGHPPLGVAAGPHSTVDDGRAAALTELRAAARAAGRPMLVRTRDPEGEWLLRIHPDGQVDPLDALDPAPVPHPAPVAAEPAAPRPLPTLDRLLATRPPAKPSRATMGWRVGARRLTGGLWSPAPGVAELRHRAAVRTVQRSLNGPKTVVVINPKGGAFKTTAALLIAQAAGVHRGGSVLAWDNNETRGTMGWRAQHSPNTTTATDLLRDIDRFVDRGGRFGDLGNYVRSQGDALFDVLASHEDPHSAGSIDAPGFTALHQVLMRYYRVLVVDTGNNMLAPNWRAAIAAADQLVIVSSVREDTAQSAAWAADSLLSSPHGEKLRNAVTVLAAPSGSFTRRQRDLRKDLHSHFGELTRDVLDVPYDPALVDGGPIDFDGLSKHTREAWLQVTASVINGV